jgi:hypothetical protein
MKVVAYYTAGTTYETEADLFERSLKKCGITNYLITPIEKTKDWYAATALKAFFLHDSLMKHGEPILYCDVDAVFHQNPTAYFEALERRFDFAAHWFQGPAGGADKTVNANRLLSGTLWLNYTEKTKQLLSAWGQMNSLLSDLKIPEGGGQKNLWYMTTCMKDLRIKKIPGRYCYVFDKPWAYPDNEPRIIEHTIASRENRNRVRVDKGRRDYLEKLEKTI